MNQLKIGKKEVIIMSGKKEFVEPVLEKYEEKLDQVTKGAPPLGSPAEDSADPK